MYPHLPNHAQVPLAELPPVIEEEKAERPAWNADEGYDLSVARNKSSML